MHGKCVDCWVNEEGDLSTLEVDLDFEIIDGIVFELKKSMIYLCSNIKNWISLESNVH